MLQTQERSQRPHGQLCGLYAVAFLRGFGVCAWSFTVLRYDMNDTELVLDLQKMDWWSRAAKRKHELRLIVKYSRRYGVYWKKHEVKND